jgi:hypothetical protein
MIVLEELEREEDTTEEDRGECTHSLLAGSQHPI